MLANYNLFVCYRSICRAFLGNSSFSSTWAGGALGLHWVLSIVRYNIMVPILALWSGTKAKSLMYPAHVCCQDLTLAVEPEEKKVTMQQSSCLLFCFVCLR